MIGIAKRIDWVAGNLFNQVLFFIVIFFFYVKGMKSGLQTETVPMYMGIYLLITVIAMLNALFVKGLPRHFICMVFQMLNVFLIPIILNACGFGINVLVFSSLAYVVICVAISDIPAGIGVILAAIGFACFIHYENTGVLEHHPVFRKQIMHLDGRVPQGDFQALAGDNVKMYKVSKDATLQEISALKDVYNSPKKWEYLYRANMDVLDAPDKKVAAGKRLRIPPLPKINPMDYVKISVAYIGAGILAFCWKLLILKLYTLYMMAMSKSSEKFKTEIEDLKTQLSTLNKDHGMLKEEFAMHIIEMNKITSYKKES